MNPKYIKLQIKLLLEMWIQFKSTLNWNLNMKEKHQTTETKTKPATAKATAETKEQTNN